MDDDLGGALAAYPGGLRTGDVDLLGELFLADGRFFVDSGGDIVSSTFADVLGTWASRPDPAVTGAVLDSEVVGGSMARATYELTFHGKRYVDHLLLYRVGGRWRVVAKTTTVT